MPVWPHSPRWPTSRTRCSSAFILHAGLNLVRAARLASFSFLPTATTRFSFDLITADLRSDVCLKRRVRHHLPTSHTCCSSDFIRLADLHLLDVPCLPSFSSLANIVNALPVWPHSPRWPTSRTCCSSALILLAGLNLVRAARLASFSLLATATMCCSFDLITADLRLDMC